MIIVIFSGSVTNLKERKRRRRQGLRSRWSGNSHKFSANEPPEKKFRKMMAGGVESWSSSSAEGEAKLGMVMEFSLDDGGVAAASSKALRAQDSSEETMEDMNGDSFQKVKQRFKDRTMKVAQTKEMLSKQAVQTKEILSKQAVTHLLRVLGFGGFCFLLGASEWNWFDS
ncbi:glycerophosphocholine acyltransferase 1 [Fagus crenata]